MSNWKKRIRDYRERKRQQTKKYSSYWNRSVFQIDVITCSLLYTGMQSVSHKKYLNYTEHQKKLITSSVRRSLKFTLSKLIIFGQREASEKKGLLVSKRRKCSEIAKGNFLKISEFHGDSLFRTLNSYSFDFNGRLCNRHTRFCPQRSPSPGAEQFWWFLKTELLQFHHIFLLLGWSKPLFFWMCLIRITIANLCPNMLHFDALDFSEFLSEEVKFLLMLSV